MDSKEIKKQLRMLRKMKLACRSGTPERIDLHRKIQELKEQLQAQQSVDKDKEAVIKEILRYEPELDDLIDLYSHTIENLQHHLTKLKDKEKAKCLKPESS
jgi:phage shock protein A